MKAIGSGAGRSEALTGARRNGVWRCGVRAGEIPARLERGAARLGPASAAPDLARAVGFAAAVFAAVDFATVVFAVAVLRALLAGSGFTNSFDLANDLVFAVDLGLPSDFDLAAPALAAGFLDAAVFTVLGLAVLGRVVVILLVALVFAVDLPVFADFAVLAAGLGFAALLRAAVFLAGAFSGVVLFPEAERH